jgi:hypothetical protein
MMTRWAALLTIGAFATGCSRARDRTPADTVSAIVTHSDSSARGISIANEPAVDLTAAMCDHSLATDTVGRPEYAPARELLEIMAADARVNPDTRQDVHFRAPDRLLSYVADSGLTYVDVNGVVGEQSADTIAHVTVDSLREQLHWQRGNLYEHFGSLAKLYADSATGYFRMQYCPLAGGFIAVLGHGDYTLAFRRQRGRLRLTRFAALEAAAD